MSTVVTFGNKNIVEPGVYAQIKSGTSNAPSAFSTGNVVIIDTGEGAGFGGGSGINGTLQSGSKSIYSFNLQKDFQAFVRGGILWDIADYLFNPVNGAPGAQNVSVVRAATTVPASITYDFTSSTDGGTFIARCKNEGACGNGVASGSKVRQGYGSQMKVGIVDPTKYIIEFYEGTFKGNDPDGDPYDGIAQDNANPILIARSIEFNNINDLIKWAKNDASFQARFDVNPTSAAVGTGVLVAGDYTANNTLKLATGGTTTYNPADLDSALSQMTEFDNTFFLSLKNAADAQGTENTKLLSHIVNESEFKKFIIVGGGNDALGFDQADGSIETAQYFNSPYVIVVHSGFYVKQPFSAAKKVKSSVYHAALVCGRLSGLLPQTSVTFKTIRANDFLHQLTQQQRESALQAGVLHNRFVANLGYVVNQGINSLQLNTQLINPDGTSHEITIMRIAEQLNKELVLNMRPVFVGQNLNTASPADVKAYVEGYLTFKTATKTQDNLILRFEKVNVVQVEDYYEISYCFVPNGPLNKLFVTGFILDANLSA